jgi:hypothetical protein
MVKNSPVSETEASITSSSVKTVTLLKPCEKAENWILSSIRNSGNLR